jgi:hypothetical protein
MIKRTEARALRFAQNIANYELVGIGLGWASIVDFQNIYPLGSPTHQDCGYTWEFTTDGNYNLLSGVHPSAYFRNCYALINLTTADTVIYFKTNPTDKTLVVIADVVNGTDTTITPYTDFNNESIDFSTLLDFVSCDTNQCTMTAQITVTFPTDNEASDIELTYTGGSNTTAYGLPNAMTTYFQAYFEGLGFRAWAIGGTLRVLYNPLTAFNVYNGFEILSSAVFAVQGAGEGYPYELDTNLITNEVCCTDNYCKSWLLPYGKRLAGFALFNGAWEYEENAKIYFSECDCGANIQEVNNQPSAITLTTGETIIPFDFTNDLTGTNKFQFTLAMVTPNEAMPFEEQINRITEDNDYGNGTANFGKFSGTSGDTALNVFPGVGWTGTSNDAYFGATEILYNGFGSASPILTQGIMWTIDLNLSTPTTQKYTVEIYFYSKGGLPADDTIQVYVSGATIGAAANGVVLIADTIYSASAVITVPAGSQTVTIGLGLSDGAGNIIVSTGTNDYVTVYASVKRAWIAAEEIDKGQSSQVFEACNSCYVKQFQKEDVELENGFPGHLVGGWSVAFPVELEKLNIKHTSDSTEYETSRGYHLQLNALHNKQIEFQTNWITEDQADFIYLAFGLTPFLLDGIEYAMVDGIEWEKADKLDAYQGSLSLFKNEWNKNRSLC